MLGLILCSMMHTHHYNIIRSIFAALKSLYFLPIHTSTSYSWQPTTELTVSKVLPFPEYHSV